VVEQEAYTIPTDAIPTNDRDRVFVIFMPTFESIIDRYFKLSLAYIIDNVCDAGISLA